MPKANYRHYLGVLVITLALVLAGLNEDNLGYLAEFITLAGVILLASENTDTTEDLAEQAGWGIMAQAVIFLVALKMPRWMFALMFSLGGYMATHKYKEWIENFLLGDIER